MHDLLEGVIPVTLKYVLRHFIRLHLFTVLDINDKIAESENLSHEKYKPQPLTNEMFSGKGHIKGNSSENWCLLRILPLIVGNIINEGDNVWEIYLLLREIVDIVLCNKLPHSMIGYLETCINDFLRLFTSQLPEVRMTPKMHYLVHYPRYIERYGPLTGLWAMRFEGKHYPFKQLASSIKNWKNIAMSLAKRHQLQQCYVFSDFMSKQVETIGAKVVRCASLPTSLLRAIVELDNNVPDTVCSCTAIARNGVLLKIDHAYPQKFLPNNLLQFFIIKYLLCIKNEFYVCGKTIPSTEYIRHYCAYIGEESTEWHAFSFKDTLDGDLFIDFHYVTVCKIANCNELFVTLHHGVYDL